MLLSSFPSSGQAPVAAGWPRRCHTRALTLSWEAEVVLTSQMVGTSLRLSACGKSGVSGMSDRESTDEEKIEALERSSRNEGS